MKTHILYRPVPYAQRKGFFEIPGFSRYAASVQGEILNKRLNHVTLGGSDGYYRRISAYPDGLAKPRLVYAHDLVCRAFYGAPEAGMVVLHADNNKLNNRSDNLSWGTQSANIQQVWDDGLRSFY